MDQIKRKRLVDYDQTPERQGENRAEEAHAQSKH